MDMPGMPILAMKWVPLHKDQAGKDFIYAGLPPGGLWPVVANRF